jgi:hypothetical protein
VHAPRKLVTSAALVPVFAFFALSTGPGLDIKQFGKADLARGAKRPFRITFACRT